MSKDILTNDRKQLTIFENNVVIDKNLPKWRRAENGLEKTKVNNTESNSINTNTSVLTDFFITNPDEGLNPTPIFEGTVRDVDSDVSPSLKWLPLYEIADGVSFDQLATAGIKDLTRLIAEKKLKFVIGGYGSLGHTQSNGNIILSNNMDTVVSSYNTQLQKAMEDSMKKNFFYKIKTLFKKNNLKRNIEALDNDAQHYKEKYIQDFQKGLEEGKYQISDFPKYYEDVIIKDENVKRTQDILEKRENEYNVIKEKTSTNLYNNTAGEQEARNVQDRIKLPTNEKKKTLPFIKNENTVYADKSNESHEVVYKENGSFDRVKIKENIFENNNGKSITRTIKDYLVEHIGEYADIIESGQRVYLGEELPGEYAHSKSMQSLPIAQKLAKGRVLPGIKEIINNATNRQYEANRKTKHNTDAKYGFYRYDTKFSFDYNGKEHIYAGTILIRNDANGKKYLYDVTNIKKIGSNLLPVASNSQKSSAIIGSSNSLPTNSIPSSNENVNTNKKSTHKSEKYSLPTKEWQQYLDENYKPTGTRTNLEDIRLPVKENNKIPVNEEAEIANILQKPQEKVKEKDRSWAIIKANLIDKGMVFEELSRKTGNRDLQGKWDYTLTSTARGQNAIGNARYELDPNTKTQKQISKSLTDIIEEVGENTADFYSYMYHQLNIDRMTLKERFSGDTGINYERRNPIMNKPVFGESVTAKMSIQKVAELEKKHPEFKEYAQDVYDYLDANTKELVDNGVISKETQQLFKDMYPHYVPISRVRNKGQAINVPLDTGRTGVNSPIKKATGGSSDINPLFETMADRTLQTYRASARNSFGLELKNTLGKTNQILEKADVDIIIENMTDEEQNKQLLQEGKNGENPTFTVFENGNKVTYEINKDMYDALKPKNELLSKIDENKASKIANKINNFRRGLLTEYNPVFSITNAIKDSQDILLNSQHSAKTYAKIPEATAQILSKGYWYNEYIQNGGSQNSYFKDGEFETSKNNLPTKIKNTLTIPLKAISNVNNVIEMTPRLAEYIVSREQGKSIETSMLDAARVTTNFKAGGDITKTLNRNGFTFLNASVQGMQQQIRNVQLIYKNCL